MAVTIKRDGYAQVELNHVDAPRNGGVYANLPAAESIDVLEQGMFVHYDYAAGEVNLNGEGPLMMVFNEEKLYEERHQMHKNYAQVRAEAFDKVIVPRLFRLSVGDLYTTNAVAEGSYSVGDDLCVDAATGWLKVGDAPMGEPALRVVAETVMPDMQPAVKLQVIGA